MSATVQPKLVKAMRARLGLWGMNGSFPGRFWN
jgi:hypothetical protein